MDVDRNLGRTPLHPQIVTHCDKHHTSLTQTVLLRVSLVHILNFFKKGFSEKDRAFPSEEPTKATLRDASRRFETLRDYPRKHISKKKRIFAGAGVFSFFGAFVFRGSPLKRRIGGSPHPPSRKGFSGFSRIGGSPQPRSRKNKSLASPRKTSKKLSFA